MLVQEKQYHEELKLEVTVSSDIASRDAEADFLDDLRQIAEDDDNMSKIMMSRKKRKLLIAMEYGQEKKRAKARLLTERKKKIAEAKASA